MRNNTNKGYIFTEKLKVNKLDCKKRYVEIGCKFVSSQIYKDCILIMH